MFSIAKIYRNRQAFDLIHASGIWISPGLFLKMLDTIFQSIH